MTRIIIDSTCDLPAGYKERFGFRVLPLSVVVNDEAAVEDTQTNLDYVYQAIRAGHRIGTAQIQWEDTMRQFREVAQAGDDFIYLAFSSAMSGTCQLARSVLEELAGDYPDRRMEIVDSMGGSMGSGLIAMELGLMLEHGVDYDGLLAQCRWMTEHVHYAYTIDDLKHAMRGGRLLSFVAGGVTDFLNIKPLMDVRNGMLHVAKIVRGSKRALAAVADMIALHAGEFKEQLISISHADDPQRAEAMKQLIQERLPGCRVVSQRIGAVLGCHLGIGGVGVSCLDARPDVYYLPDLTD